MSNVIPSFDQARVLVIGDVMLDRYWHGDTERISPEAPVPVVRVAKVEGRPGGAANVAVNVAGLGASVTLIGLVGDDEAGRQLEDALVAQGVCSELVVRGDSVTTCKMRVLGRHQQLLRLDIEECEYTPEALDALRARVDAQLSEHDVVVLSDYAKGALEQVAHLIEACRRCSVPVIVDPKGHSFERYRGATGITPNLGELRGALGPAADITAIETDAAALCASLDLEWLLVTRGEAGMTLVWPDGTTQHQPARAQEVFDVTGAGDTVIATLASALAAGEAIQSALAWSNTAAGIVVSKLGTSSVSWRELSAASRPNLERGTIVDELPELVETVRHARGNGDVVVMTNGCFDILHAGHVQYLEEARAFGTHLVVAVNSDESVCRLKGASRPINSLRHRMQVLAALRSVDWVIAFDEDTPAALVAEVDPDVLVKGGDYMPGEIAGGDVVIARGGSVRTVALVPECSTSGTIAAISARATSS